MNSKLQPPLLSTVASALLMILTTSAHAQVDRVTGRAFATRSEVIARNGIVATSHPLATQIGLDILKAGGSAVDAAVAANAALGLMEPVSCGIGGDLFAIVWDAPTKKLYGLNASGRSPLGLSYDQMKAELARRGVESIPRRGLLPISVPGCVDGWFELHERFGKLPMIAVLHPAITYAEEGFPMTELIAHYWAESVPLLRDQPGAFLETFTMDGRAPAKGEVFRNPYLANTYRWIANQGRDVFYKDELADRMDAFFQANDGYLRKIDFEKHTSAWVEPVSVNYRGYDVYELPPNGQGIAALQMLNVLEELDLRAMGFNSPPTKTATWFRSSRAIIAEWAPAWSCPDWDSDFRIVASCSPWSRATRTSMRRANGPSIRSFPLS